MNRGSWGPKGSEQHKAARAAYMRGYRKQERGRAICQKACSSWRDKNPERYETGRRAWVESPNGRRSTRATSRRFIAKAHREGWARGDPGPCVSCGKLTRWRAQRLAILIGGRTVQRWIPCCRGC